MKILNNRIVNVRLIAPCLENITCQYLNTGARIIHWNWDQKASGVLKTGFI